MNEAPLNPRLTTAVLASAVLLLLTGLGQRGLWAPDEPRYAQVAEELRAGTSGPADLVLLHLNGRPYTQKPPLYYWLAAAFGAPFGRVGETVARLPSALAGVACVALTLAFGRRLLGGATGALGGILLLSVAEFAFLSRRVQLDVLLTLFETLALFAFWRFDRGMGRRATNLALFHASLGLAVLTKGPVGFLVPVLVVVATLAWERRLRALRPLFPLWGWPLSLGPGLAWVAAATALAPPGYFEKAVGENVFGRYFAGTSHARPFYYYAFQLPADFLPWTLLLPLVVWAARRRVFAGPAGGDGEASPEERRAWRFLLAWVGASILFFSISTGKRGLYLIPCFPALALLCADSLLRFLAGRLAMPRPLVAGSVLLAALSTLLAVAMLAGVPEPVTEIEAGARLAFGVATLSVTVLAAAAWAVYARNRARLVRRAVVVVAGVLAVELACFLVLLPGLDASKSPRAIARAAAEITPPDRPIGLWGDRAMAGGLVYYADRPVAQLDSPEDVRRFLDGGGSAIVVKERKLDNVEQVAPVRVQARFREGRRTVLVVTPGDAAGELRAPEG